MAPVRSHTAKPQRGHDTNLAVVSRFRRLIMAKSREERLIMGCSMFNTAKQIVKSAILNKSRRIMPRSIKKEIFIRFYGMEFNKLEKEKISKVLRQRKHKRDNI